MLKDIRYGIKSLVRNPAFTAIAIITLSLGIGANTAIFSVVNAVLLRPLPFADANRIVWLWDTIPQLPTAPTSLPEFLDWKQQNRSFEQLAAFQSGSSFVDAGDGTEDVRVGIVTPEMFSLFRVNPIIGEPSLTKRPSSGNTAWQFSAIPCGRTVSAQIRMSRVERYSSTDALTQLSG